MGVARLVRARFLTLRNTVALVSDPGDETRDDASLVIQSALAGDADAVVTTFDNVVDRRGMSSTSAACHDG